MSKKSSKSLLLVDGSSYLYRAFHALPPLTTSKGLSSGAIFGVVKMLRSQLQELQPDLAAVVFDAKGKTFRDKIYSDYKANRPPMPDDLREQIQPLHAIVKALGLPVLIVEGVEADDVIGTLAMQAQEAKMPVIISTGDKDMAQLVSNRISLVNTMSNTTLDPDGVMQKFSVRPDQIIDYLALVGDSADNIPGIPKVGPKTAAKWLNEYENLEAIIANAEQIKGKVGENLRANLEQLKLSKQLATIKCDVKLDCTPEQLKMQPADTDTLKKWYTELEFRSLLSEIIAQDQDSKAHKATKANKSIDYQLIFTQAELDDWIDKLKKADIFAFDTETTSVHAMEAELVGISVSTQAQQAAYIPLAHDYDGAPKQLDRQTVLDKFKPLLESKNAKIVGQHIKYDKNVLSNYGINLTAIKHDTMMQSYVVNSTQRHDMDSLALKYLGHKTIHFEDIAGKGAKQLRFNQIELEKAGPYAAEDADITLQLHQALWQELVSNKHLKSLYETIELPLIQVLAKIEQTGVLIDQDLLAQQSKELEKQIKSLEKKAFELAGKTFNLGSPKQIQEILFSEQGLPVIKKTPKGQPSTAEEVLQELALDFPLPKLILEHRSLSKLKSTYVDKLPLQINAKTKRIHTSYHQAVAATGRLSSSDPNLQNIPVRTEQGRKIREAFIAPRGYSIVAADYSQIELRIMAHLSADKQLLAAFAAGEDVHKATASQVFSTPLQQVTREQRRSAKAINFGLIYGMSAFGLARQLGIDRNQAQKYVDMYFEQYPGVKQYMDKIRESAHENGYVETLYGRRLYLPEINSKNAMRRQYAERTAINAPMQGSAADIIKKAMLALHEWIGEDNENISMVMQVHDELVFEVKNSFIDEAKKSITKLMTNVVTLSVPLLVDIGQGKNWNQAH